MDRVLGKFLRSSQALVGDNGDRVGPENRLDLDGVTFAASACFPSAELLRFGF